MVSKGHLAQKQISSGKRKLCGWSHRCVLNAFLKLEEVNLKIRSVGCLKVNNFTMNMFICFEKHTNPRLKGLGRCQGQDICSTSRLVNDSGGKRISWQLRASFYPLKKNSFFDKLIPFRSKALYATTYLI